MFVYSLFFFYYVFLSWPQFMDFDSLFSFLVGVELNLHALCGTNRHHANLQFRTFCLTTPKSDSIFLDREDGIIVNIMFSNLSEYLSKLLLQLVF